MIVILDFPDLSDWLEALTDAEILLSSSFDLQDLFDNIECPLPDWPMDRRTGLRLYTDLCRQVNNALAPLRAKHNPDFRIIGVEIDDENDAVCLDIRIRI